MKEFILKYKFIIIGVFVLTAVLIGGTYAWINIELFGEKTNKIIAGTLELELDESTCTEINITNAIPITDEEGMKQVACTFTLENTGSLDSDYTIYLDDEELLAGETRMNDNDVKYSLMKNSSNKIEYLSQTGTHPNRVVDNGILTTGSSNSYELRLWIAENASVDAMGKTVATTLRVTSGVYQPTGCLDIPTYGGVANEPELVGDMIPVTYDGTNWVKADTSNTSKSWYDYDEQIWANAVTVTEANRATHVAAAVGTTIPMEDINTFMVWIPRYSYTIKDTYGVQGCGGETPSVTTPGAIDIKFVESSTTELGTAAYTGNIAENWFTNSAFCWGNSCDDESTRANSENKELAGIWVGKFETSYKGCNSVWSCRSTTVQEPLIKPNLYTWTESNVSNYFNSIKENMNQVLGQNIYGLSGSTHDAHMIKNTEWGATAYLSQSRYGKYGNEDYTGSDKEIFINDCSDFITGISSDGITSSTVTCTTNTYETIKGQAASTTGNIYGIYDMSGGAAEYVMGNMVDDSGNFYSSYSGFTTPPETKYYNSYTYGTSESDFSRGMLGDSTKDTLGFYSDYSRFIAADNPWIIRGGEYIESGIFSFVNYSGGINDGFFGTRITLIP